MNDLISRQAAIDALKRDEALVIAFGYHNAIDAIMELPTAERRGKWIAVEERMPQDGEWAIFTDGKNISVERYKMDIGQDHFFPSGRWFDLEDAIAWMPSPKHYHGTENKNEH